MIAPAFQLKACQHKDIAINTPVINKSDLEYFVYIEADPEIMRNCRIYQVDEITSSGSVQIPFPGPFIRDVNCWLRATTALLNTKAGQHVYKISFIDSHSAQTFGLYVSYIIQDDNPDKPYIYMKREEDQ